MQAIILAAGMGKRLKDLTNDNTKCMVKVNGVTIIERMLGQLDKLDLSKIVIVTGYKGEKLKEYISTLKVKTEIEYIDNDIYDKTNNIYSLYLARENLLNEDTLLLESDLIFEDGVLEKILGDKNPNLALVAKYKSWMDGTVVTLGEDNSIKNFLNKNQFNYNDTDSYYKTVNIYKFSKEFSSQHYVPFLEAYSKALGNNEYYEQVLRVIAYLDKAEIKAATLDNEIWYEIDDIQDLDIAESLFAPSKEEKLKKIQSRYGGYWRYSELKDFCYLVNPYYPPKRLRDELKANFDVLLCEYPSGLEVNNLLAAKYFGLNRKHIIIGNGAAELIKGLMEGKDGKVGVVMPTFQEYPNRKNENDVVPYYPNNEDYAYTADDLMNFYEGKDISRLLVINPDNPSGNYILKADILRLAEWTSNRGIELIVDESFIDFSDKEENPTLLDEAILNDFRNLIVVKSISKSYGVPGLRLGVLASANEELISDLKKDVSIWNINSFGEFYMQIAEKYRSDYEVAMSKFKENRKDYIEKLNQIENLRVIPTQANYVLCEVKGITACKLTEVLLDKYNIFIKDLSNKKGINGEYIRIAVKSKEDNESLVYALKEELN